MYENFYSAMYRAHLLYDAAYNSEDDFAEVGLIAWERIGNKHTRLYHTTLDIDPDTLSAQLPCNCDIIEAVTLDWEDWNNVSPDWHNGDINSLMTEHYIEARKGAMNPLYTHGRFAKFERVGDTLYFDKNYGHVHLLFKGIILDENELPMLTPKEVDAIAVFTAYMNKFKEAIKTNNKDLMQVALKLEQMWITAIDRARTPEYIDQNTMDEILNVKASYNRKLYGKSYKPIQK